MRPTEAIPQYQFTLPATPIVGEKPLILEGSGTVTVNAVALVAVDDVIVAAVPLKVTAFCAGVGLKPVPVIVTGVPIGPELGAKPVMATVGARQYRCRLTGSRRFRRAR
jgi:hypothetical protein